MYIIKTDMGKDSRNLALSQSFIKKHVNPVNITRSSESLSMFFIQFICSDDTMIILYESDNKQMQII